MWQQQKVANQKNAYLLIYKRRIQDEVAFEDDVVDPNTKTDNQSLGLKHFEPSPDSHMYKKVQDANHKYWQNRYLLSPEFHEFAQQIATMWNTHFAVPTLASSRNDDD